MKFLVKDHFSKNLGLIKYVVKFILSFCFLYYGAQLIIGLSAPGNYYSSFVHKYLDFVSVLRNSLLYASKWTIGVFEYDSIVQYNFYLKIIEGSRVRMVYSCLGIGLFSFWAAFVIANSGTWWHKVKWVVGGVFLIWLINIARISLLIIATNDRWVLFTKIDHHTLFNIAAYAAIFLMMYFFDKSQKKLLAEKN